MEKQTSGTGITQETVIINQSPARIAELSAAIEKTGFFTAIPVEYDIKGCLSNIIRGVLEVLHVKTGHISLLLRVKPVVANIYGALHGGVVASVAERVAEACARTVMGNEKNLFLGELSNSYLSGARLNAEVIVEASIIRTGRNLTVVSVEFRIKESNKLVYISRATFYNMPVSNLHGQRNEDGESDRGITQETVIIDQSPERIAELSVALERTGISSTIPLEYDIKGYILNIIGGVLEVLHVETGRISFLLRVKPVVTNEYGALHGGVVASVAERVAEACARTVMVNEKDLFLGESSSSYLSGARLNTEVKVEASIVRRGRNLTVVSVEFRMKESDKLVYTSRATFYNMPLASL
ncbi:hypothetical protein AG4045_023978 [Apium graveolens]|uniref:Thioesterase domain-containing protein n=1 Tax=Apium graveolens TaxID=4045 RepID=A0A6L5B890_APIGR|nr:hypothetical protein AG4045_023978 [Apium graveolens]